MIVNLKEDMKKHGEDTGTLRKGLQRQLERLRASVRKLEQQSRQHATGTDSGYQLSYEERHMIALQTADSYLAFATKVWNICLVSIPLDFLLLEYNVLPLLPELLLENLFPLFLFICLIAVGFSFREQILGAFQSAYIFVKDHPQIKVLSILSIIAVTAIAFAVEFFLYSKTTVFAGLIQFIVYAGAFYSVIASNSRKVKGLEQYVTLLKRDLFVANIFPILAARLILPLGILSLQLGNESSDMMTIGLLVALSFLSLLELVPNERHFVARCRRCGVIVPLRLLETPECVRCNTGQDLKGRPLRR